VRRKAAEVKARVEEKRAKLKRLCSRLPAIHQTWTQRQAADFKAAAANGMTIANNPRVTEARLDQSIRHLESFYF
jgi:hypothetical protein